MSETVYEYSQAIGKSVFCGTLKPSKDDKSVLDIYFFEGTVKDVICHDRFSPILIKTDKGLYSCPLSWDDYFQIMDERGRELGWFIVDLSKKNLLRRLREIYRAMMVANEAKEWLGLNGKNLCFDGMPDVVQM